MRHWFAGIAVLMALAGCAEFPLEPDLGPMLGPPLEQFAADGRISLRQGERSDHFRFDWRHAPAEAAWTD